MYIICATLSIQNFDANIIIMSKVAIDELNRHRPQPVLRGSSFLNVIKDRTPLTSPATAMIIVNAILICTING
jgi:hypothetical protein